MSNTKQTGASLRGKNMMYTQQLKHLPFKDIDTLEQTIQQLDKLKDYALIVHDKDVENGKAVEPHIHVMMRFDETVRLNTLAKDLHDKPQQVVQWRGDSNNGYSYLIHSTEHSRHKHQYDVSEVRASFDYPKHMLDVAKKVEGKYRKVAINQQLDALLRGDITKTQLESLLTGSQYADNKRRIDAVYHKRLENLAVEYKEYMKAHDIRTKVIWIYGNAGTGKTKLAKEYASKHDKNYFISGSTRDIFQSYEGQRTIILDELRPRSIESYADLLRLLDPFGEEKMAPSRYFDKSIVADLIVITSPYNPSQFYEQLNVDDDIDSFAQLYRRIALTIHMTDTSICMVAYVPSIKAYTDNLFTAKHNKYSWNNQSSVQLDVNDLYDDIVG